MAQDVAAVEDAEVWMASGEAKLEQAAAVEDRILGTGRGAARAVVLAHGLHGVWRTNRHGGLLGGVRGAGFADAKRLQQEVTLSESLRLLQVCTPRVLLALARRHGLSWRQHLVTEEIQGATTVFEARADGAALEAAGTLLQQVFDLGLWATDLHPANLLWRAADQTCWLIDLAGAKLLDRPLDLSQRAQRGERFLRYFRKHAGAEPEGAEAMRRDLWQG